MADAPILGGSKKVKLDDGVWGAGFNGPLVHESVRAELNARRQGTAATKTRGLVRGGGAKPWRQKGTGRARAGSSRSPIWTGGGTVFGPSPRHYTFKVNRKERIAALRSALSVHASRDSIAILDPAPFSAPSTKQAAELLAGWQDTPSVLVIIEDLSEEARETDSGRAALSFRNIDRVYVAEASTVGVADVIGAGSLLVTEEALAALTARAGRATKKEATA
ncbi:MAG: 50S ribosomal protein L4 [Solirubrobacteraceae bacterium]|nr:50S ribosomal protein L4 [Solirubrobacteraceae bacterium]